MPDLSPDKLLIVFVVVVVLLGPKRLPEVARQLGSGWRRVRELGERVDQEVRRNMPDLPSTQEIARLARSPAAFLDQLAAPATQRDAAVVDRSAPTPGRDNGNGAARPLDGRGSPGTGQGRTAMGDSGRAAPLPLQPIDDPSMN